MGRVYKARQENPPRDVAFKVLRRGLLSRSAAKRFEIECRLLGRLHHGGIAQVYEAGTHVINGDRIPWIAMELIEDSTSLSAYAQDNKLKIKTKLKLFKLVCDAVAEAHRHGIIHRDLKPANILVDTQGLPKIIDFGVAKVIDSVGMSTTLLTQDHDLIGTMQYMSPEQASGNNVDITTDVYALGVLLYELLAGERPYNLDSTTIPTAIQTIVKSHPTPLGAINRKFKGDIETIVEHAMAHNPLNRYRSATEFGDDINRILTGEPIAARRESRLTRYLRKHRRVALSLVVLVPFLMLSIVIAVFFDIHTQNELNKKSMLLDFAREALATRNEIIVTNPEYWSTHFELAMQHAQKMAGNDDILRADMYGMIASVADTKFDGTSIRLKTAELVGLDTERGALLAIKHHAHQGGLEAEERIPAINKLRLSIKNPSSEFMASALIAQAHLELRSTDDSTRNDGREHTAEALVIIENELDDDFKLKHAAILRLAWANVFMKPTNDSALQTLVLLNDSFISQTAEELGELHPDTLTTLNLRGLACEILGDFDAAIEILRPLALTTVEHYGIGHNFTWRYLNNLAVVIEMKSDSPEISSDTSRTLKLQAATLLTQCVHQSMMHFDRNGIPWYINTFHEILPAYAPTEEELATWRDIVKHGLETEFSNIDYMSVLKLRELDSNKQNQQTIDQ